MKNPENIQIADLVKAMAISEPCLFNNSSANLMPVTIRNFNIPIFEDNITYTEWCEALELDPNDDENSISWSEMKNNNEEVTE